MRGTCLCGAVRYEVAGPARSVVACHCSQCRKTSGHYVAATQVLIDDLQIEGSLNITWFQSSASARRGFCKTCGSQLFWTETASRFISVMAGTIDGETGLVMDRQLFADMKGDYYDLPAVEKIEQSAL
jgi:hypothetical protein